MSSVDLVRASRDGDHFHYYWAARQCLKLLDTITDLVAVTIEGPSSLESEEDVIEAGAELIDVGLYYKSEDVAQARLIRYIQLKHSTALANTPWTGSGMKKTITGFAARYLKLRLQLEVEGLREKVRFEFLTNRPISDDVLETLEDLAAGVLPRNKSVAALLTSYCGLVGEELQNFFQLFTAQGGEPDLWEQRNLLSTDSSIFLSEPNADAVVYLKDLVSRQATSAGQRDPSIRKTDVLRAFKVDMDQLFPAPCQIGTTNFELAREQDTQILQSVLGATYPVIIYADGGVGKSMLALRLGALMPAGSVAVVYDCYGDGLYRNALNLRHRHLDAFVQIANELAAQGLCHPLIPTSHADIKLLTRAFQGRLAQASSLLRARDSSSALCIIIDAADNAGMAAEERQERSFVSDLIGMQFPDGVRLVLTSRPHRRHYLSIPNKALSIRLEPFSQGETAKHLQNFYPAATLQEAQEFALLSSSNPRVQALALAQQLPLGDMLRRLGPTPTTIERTISDLLAAAVARLKEHTVTIESAQVDVICRCLAVLRPLIPIPVLAKMAGTTESAIRNFALDLRRPLLVKGDSLHFLDEPSETWFRDNFTPSSKELESLLERLRPLTAHSAYAASVLPQLLLQAGKLDELIELALSDSNLPTDNPLAKRDVELQRLSFALKACLSAKRYKDAAKLALRAGGESAAESRQNSLIQENTDLAAYLLPADRIEEIVSRRSFKHSWLGSSQAYYASLLSGRPELRADATSRLRMATDWLMAWARQSKSQSRSKRIDVTDADRTEFTLAILRVNGAESAARFLRQWSPRSLALETGRRVTARLLDQGDTVSVDALFFAAGNNVWLLLGVVLESAAVGFSLNVKPLKRLLRLLGNRHVLLKYGETFRNSGILLAAVTATIELALRTLPADTLLWVKILERYLPKAASSDLVERHGRVNSFGLRAYALHAELSGIGLTFKKLAPSYIREFVSPDGKVINHNSDAESFCRNLDGVLPWFVLGACAAAGHNNLKIEETIKAALNKLKHAEEYQYYNSMSLTQTIAVEWLIVLRTSRLISGAPWEQYEAWFETVKEKLWPITLIAVCRLAAHIPELRDFAFKIAPYTYQRIETLSDADAESRVESYQALARAILSLSKEEASTYFDQAIEIASRIGQENLNRWNALIYLGKAAGVLGAFQPVLAYKFARAAELTYSYSEDHFDWNGTVEALGRLCPPSLLAISSRWRDRRFGHLSFMVSHITETLIHRGQLPEKAAVVMGGIDAQWDRFADLEQAIDKEPSIEGRRRLLVTAYRYMRLQYHRKETWQKIKKLGRQLNTDLLDIDRLISSSPDDKSSTDSDSGSYSYSAVASEVSESEESDWSELLDIARLGDAAHLLEVFERRSGAGEAVPYATFIAKGLSKAGPGNAAAFIRAVSSWGSFDLYNLRGLLDTIPQPYKQLHSIRAAIKIAVLAVCQRTPSNITIEGPWVALPIAQLDQEGIVSYAEVVAAILKGSVDQVQDADSDQLFRLLSPLAASLEPAEAADALNYGLDLLQNALVDDKGDGTWDEALRPPASTLSALAGYIWSGLGSPIGAERWEFAHVVCNAVEVQWDSLLDELVLYAGGKIAGPFADHRLEFYSWHARQWLLIGLARGALARKDLPPSCITHILRELKIPHVLIREFAAQALIAANIGQESQDLTNLLSVNTSPLPERVTTSYYGDIEAELAPHEDDDATDYECSFGIDIGPYWFDPLGRSFSLSQNVIERRARMAITRHVFAGEIGWSEDARYSRGVFGRYENGTYHSHGEKPRVDNLLAYCSYHAMMLVAADLLETHPTTRHEEEKESRFEEWMARHTLTRRNGMWLTDLRDPQFTNESSLPSGYPAADWGWSVTKDYLDSQLLTDDDQLVVWGGWGFGAKGDDEDISIQSVLTKTALAPALIAALQTTNSDRFYLPAADERKLDEGSKAPLVGWINHDSAEARLDEFDPWSKGMSYPSYGPSSEICRSLNLTRSDDERRWATANGGVIRSEIWTRSVSYGREQSSICGRRISVNNKFLKELLAAKPDHCIVLCVQVRRQLDRDLAEQEGLEQYPWPYKRYYMVDSDGIIRAL